MGGMIAHTTRLQPDPHAMAWKQLSVTTTKTSAETVSELFCNFGAVSVTYMDAADQPVYEPKPGDTEIWRQTKVIGLFELDSNAEIIEPLLTKQLGYLKLDDWQLDVIEDQVWERAWLEHYQPMLFADRLWVCPTDMAQQQPGKTSLILDPGLAFGTGTHATTALCLQWLAEHQHLHDKTVLDYGCGSGILAIAALLLGAKKANAVDIDPQALEATCANAEKNQVSDKVSCYLAEDYSSQPADLVLANILAGPLIELTETLTQLVAPGGTLVLSGILDDQADAVIASYRPYFHLQPTAHQDDWCRISGSKI